MATDNHTPPEGEPETLDELMLRFMSVKHRLRVAINDFADFSRDQEPAFFVMQEAMDDLEKVLRDFRAWEDGHEHTAKAPKEVQS